MSWLRRDPCCSSLISGRSKISNFDEPFVGFTLHTDTYINNNILLRHIKRNQAPRNHIEKEMEQNNYHNSNVYHHNQLVMEYL